MYDFAHGQSDYFEGVTHSLCTLEFEVHRPLYDWFIDQLKTNDYRPRQIEFNRLNLTYTMMSKRKLLELVQEGKVIGWDDPRMPTLCGLRRRGYTPESIKRFVDLIGYTKVEAINDVSLLEHAVREDLNLRTPRVFGVLNPLKVIITNYDEAKVENVVFDRGYAWSGPGVFTGLVFFFPGVNLTIERHFAILSFYDDLMGVHYRCAFKRILDRGFNFRGGSSLSRFEGE